VPREPTDEMVAPLCRMWLLSDQAPLETDYLEATGYVRAVIASSPYAKKEVG